MSPIDFYRIGIYLFGKYLGTDYAEDFNDYFNMIMLYDAVETTALIEMLFQLSIKIVSCETGDFDMIDFNAYCEMMACEEMMKIIRENSSIMDNDGE